MKNSLRLKTLALAALLALTGFTSLNANAQVFGDLRPGVPGAGAPGGAGPGGGHGGGFDDRGGGRPGFGGGGGFGGGRGDDWDFCANEGQYCSVRGTFDIAYGANGRYFYRQNVDVRNGFQCSNNAFGDPLSGVKKACYVKRARFGGGPGGPGGGPGHGGGGPGHGGGGHGGGGGFPPARWTYCAREGETCFVGRSAEVRYGANGRYNTLNVRNSIACNNNTFGDPIKGVAKTCEYLVR